MSRLKGKPPVLIKKRLKAFFYGDAGTGKTYCAVQFPKTYYIDTEKGAEHKQYVDFLTKNGSVIYQTRDYDDLYSQVVALSVEKHNYETLVIDPCTSIYTNLVNFYGEKETKGDMGRPYKKANQKFEMLIDLLLRIDMNVIVTSHIKKEYGDSMTVIGETYDTYKKMKYLFDLTLESKMDNRSRIAVVKKSRIKNIEVDSVIKFDYTNIKSLIDKEWDISGEAVSLNLATEEQVMVLNNWYDEKKAYVPWMDKCLASVNVFDFSQLTSDQAEKMINSLIEKEVANGN